MHNNKFLGELVECNDLLKYLLEKEVYGMIAIISSLIFPKGYKVVLRIDENGHEFRIVNKGSCVLMS